MEVNATRSSFCRATAAGREPDVRSGDHLVNGQRPRSLLRPAPPRCAAAPIAVATNRPDIRSTFLEPGSGKSPHGGQAGKSFPMSALPASPTNMLQIRDTPLTP